MSERGLRFWMFIAAIVALFIAALSGAVVGVLFGHIWGHEVGLLAGCGTALLLMVGIMYAAHVFLPKERTKSPTKVFLAALTALSSAFTTISAEPSFWERAVTSVVPLAKRMGADPQARNVAELRLPFAIVCFSVVAICVLAWQAGAGQTLETDQLGADTEVTAAALIRRRRVAAVIEVLSFPALTLLLWALLSYRAAICLANAPVGEAGKDSALLSSWERLGLATVAAATLAGIYFVLNVVLVWSRNSRAIREQYAMFGLAASICLPVAVAVSIGFGPRLGGTPWAALVAVFRIAGGVPPMWLQPHWAATAFSALLVTCICALVFFGYSKWGGLTSADQFRQDQRREQPSLALEGLGTWAALIRTGRLPAVYTPPMPTYPEPTPEPTPLPWKDRARELLRLKTTSYALGPEAVWHDQAHCWVGTNCDNGKRVLLFVTHDPFTSNQLQQSSQHADDVSRSAGPPLGEIIIATTDRSPDRPHIDWNGLRVACYSELELLDGLVDPREYFHSVHKKVKEDKLQDSNLTLEQVYVYSDAKPSDGDSQEQSRPVEQILDDWLRDHSRRQLALLGEYGQGKSTTTLMWVHRLIQTWRPEDRLPLLIELRGTSPRDQTLEGILASWAVRFNLNPRALLQLVIAGRVVLIFEGFDEMSLVGDAQMRLAHFRRLWEFAFPGSKILFTGRPNFFFDDEEKTKSLSIDRPQGTRPYCEAFTMLAFDINKIRESLRGCQKTGNDNRLTAARDLRPAMTGPCPFHKENCHGGRLYAGGVF